jgi:PEP-CTERM/exosortase A-associated glycosyltransferase
LENSVLKRVDGGTVICEGLRADIVERGLAPEKVTVIPNGVDQERFRREKTHRVDLKEKFDLDDRDVIGFIGSFYAYEGLALLIQALPSILEVRPSVKVLLVGGGPQKVGLEALTKEIGVSEHVVFTGRVPQEEIEDYYDVINVLVYPRLSMRLTEIVTPLKPLEAMARSRLVVASDVGGHRELITHGENGRLFRAGDPNDLSRVVADLLNERDSWEGLIRRGREYVKVERNWLTSVSRYRPLYERLANR